ncbi:Protein of unknown function DUF885 [Penicillium desertorum]|uniref:Uncharacterized protein n=1 Tax=Penicillium desertorum TaxID=1303715 RepID=A0A9X0BVA3_9EURO|nr:Protein of unknown function DUF885 [Penicillium desertorum]
MGHVAPQECVDLLVDEVGHERATAKGEPLYQAGYMLGALQIHALRKETVEIGQIAEKEFHDEFLEYCMPIEPTVIA